MAGNRLIIPVTRENLPQMKDRYPFIYLEHGRLEIDDSSVKWIGAEKNIIHLPIAEIGTLLLGPGTSVTHEAMKIVGAANCTVCWVGVDSMFFYAQGKSPTANTRNVRKQAFLSSSSQFALIVARRMFSYRFPHEDVSEKGFHELMGMEGKRVRALYEKFAQQYQVGWEGRSYIPGKFEMGTVTNRILTAANTALYGVILSFVHSLGYSPYLGFVHTGSPLPFVYDLADLYKAEVTIELAFQQTSKLAGEYNGPAVATAFRQKLEECNILKRIPDDIESLFKELPDGGSGGRTSSPSGSRKNEALVR